MRADIDKLDLEELTRLADCDPRSIVSYYSPRRASMRPRIRARIERALTAMRERAHPSEEPQGPRAA